MAYRVDITEKAEADILAFYAFPAAHWRRIRHPNLIERTFESSRALA